MTHDTPTLDEQRAYIQGQINMLLGYSHCDPEMMKDALRELNILGAILKSLAGLNPSQLAEDRLQQQR